MERIYYTLLKKYGYQNWWPIYDGKEPFIEISVGAILTQNTSWKNVEKAILNLKRENLLTKNSLKNVDEKTLQELIKPAGFYKRKSKTIKSFIEKIDGRKDIDRDFLLSIKGIGRETADTILLYGLNKPFEIHNSVYDYENNTIKEYDITASHNVFTVGIIYYFREIQL